MKIVRFSAQRKVRYGLLDGDAIIGIKGSPFTQFKDPGNPLLRDGTTYRLDGVRLLAPCLPSKIVCLGLNYRSHAEETKLDIPKVPLIILKPSTAVIGPGSEIILPPNSMRVDYEGELGVVIGRKAKDVPQDKWQEYVLGYTCVNDVSERFNQAEDGQWTRAKSYDTFAPIGPCIETGINPDNLKLETRLNGELRQSARTGDLIFGVPSLISFISGVMTLLPGDIIATGTPAGIGPMNPGDVVEVTIEEIGTLRNPVAGSK
ncbi:MAG TPA: fumarylacetoacetate hydrolase family protein [Dehalococcoidia bacterium]|nr:fumarylacetoacetate hydrolase family protein [Dehalococcoidia bacterium]